jgi:exodeoxyribonuclease VII large subunit
VEGIVARIRRCASKLIEHRHTRLISASRGLPRLDDILAHARQAFDVTGSRLSFALRANTRHHRSVYQRWSAKLSLLPVKHEIARQGQFINHQHRRLRRGLGLFMSAKQRSILSAAKLLGTLSHRSVLKRGFTLVTAEGRLVSDAAQAKPAMQVSIEFHDGSVGARIDKKETAKPDKKSSGEQGKLL